MIPDKEAVRRVLSRGVVASGLSAAIRKIRRANGTLIFYGHRLTGDDEGCLQGLAPAWFAEQLSYLARYFSPLSLSELVRCYEEGKTVPSRGVVLTFDDGFRDNLTHGLPLLERYGIPATVFVVTRCISTGELPWPQRLGYLFQNTAAPRIVVPGGDDWTIESGLDRRRAYFAFKGQLAGLSRPDRDEEIERLATKLAVTPPEDRMLSWADLESMQARGIEIGAHTYSHPHLARLPAKEARQEMQQSLDDLRERLGIERPFFCFPAGSMTPELIEVVRELGFRGCFRSSRKCRYNNLESSDQFGLSRLGLPNAPGYLLEAEVDGPFHTVRSMYRS